MDARAAARARWAHNSYDWQEVRPGPGEAVPRGPSFTSRVGMGVATTVGFEVVRQFGTQGYFDTKTLTDSGFWRTTLGSAVGAAAGGVMFSAIPGGTFMGALLGQMIATYFLDKLRNITHATSGPAVEGALSLLGVQGKDTGSFRAHVESLPPRPAGEPRETVNGGGDLLPRWSGNGGSNIHPWSGTGTGSSGSSSSSGTGTGSSGGYYRSGGSSSGGSTGSSSSGGLGYPSNTGGTGVGSGGFN
jgi:hypothetical protein